MKKLIAVLVALASLVTMLAACGKEAEKKPCATHVDADKDLICDGCGRAVISIVEQLPPVTEPKVDMVVNAMPEANDFSKFWNTALVQKPVSGSKLSVVDGTLSTTYRNDVYAITAKVATNTDETEWKDVYYLYNVSLGKVIFSFESNVYTEETESNRNRCSVNWFGTGNSAFKVEYRVWNTVDLSYGSSYQYYTFSGKKLADTKELAAAEELSSANVELTVNTGYSNNGEYVYTLNGTTYLYDTETGEKVYEAAADLFVDRPAFDTVVGNYGYAIGNSGDILVYDLTKWLSCVYLFDGNGDAYILSDGKILVQETVLLPDAAVNYDYLAEVKDRNGQVIGSAKYDLVYTVINPADGSETELEFGYYIRSHSALGEEDGMKADLDLLTVSKISAQKLSDETVDVIVDSSLKILCAVEPWLPGQSVAEADMRIVADGIYLVKIKYLDGTAFRATVKADGTFLANIPEAATFVGGFAKIGSKLYTPTMKLVIDLSEEDEDGNVFSVQSERSTGIVLVKDGEYYVLRQGAAAPVKLTGENVTYAEFSQGYYLKTTEDDTETTVFYNHLGTELFKVEGAYTLDARANGVFYVTNENGNFFFILD